MTRYGTTGEGCIGPGIIACVCMAGVILIAILGVWMR